MEAEEIELLGLIFPRFYYGCPACKLRLWELHHLVMHLCYKQDKIHTDWKIAHDITADNGFKKSRILLNEYRFELTEADIRGQRLK
ncbi:MAG: hypothetical protein KKD98_05695 [Candidatus Thermoplasmatota archaeon]|nr:hypothetical protein [Candidatus Thermoplasmatota archaeon]